MTESPLCSVWGHLWFLTSVWMQPSSSTPFPVVTCAYYHELGHIPPHLYPHPHPLSLSPPPPRPYTHRHVQTGTRAGGRAYVHTQLYSGRPVWAGPLPDGPDTASLCARRLSGPGRRPSLLFPFPSSLPLSVWPPTPELGPRAWLNRPLSGQGSTPRLSG